MRRVSIFVLLCLAGSAAAAAPPAAKQPPAGAARSVGVTATPFTLEHALTLNSISSLTWSHDGRRLAFVVNSIDTAETSQNQDLWLYDRAAGRVSRLTRHPKNDFSPSFSPGGDTIAFVSTRARRDDPLGPGAGDDAKSAIYMLSLRGGEPWLFAGYDESVGEVEWSPDGRYLAFVMNDTLPKVVKDWRKKKWDQEVEDERLQYPHLWVVEVATGAKRRLTSGAQWIWNVHWAPDSHSLAFLTSPSGKPDDQNATDIGIVPVAGGPMRRLGVIGNGTFDWSPDGRWIAFAGGNDRSVFVGKEDLWVVPAGGGAAINLTAGYDGDATAPMWSVHSDSLFFHAAQGITTVVASVSRAGRRVALSLDRQADAGGPVAAPGRSVVAWVGSSPTAPPEVFVADAIGLPGRAVTSINAEAAHRTLGVTRGVEWTSTDGTTVGGVLLRPADAPARGALKTLVLLHGGPYGSRYSLGFQAVPQFYAAHGYQVFMPNFRSSSGYGTAFKLRERAAWGGQDFRDVMSGLDSLVRWGLADGNRLGVYGHSYGGYLSAWAITQTSRFDAAMVSAGAVDLAAHWAQSDIQKYRAYEFGGRPWETDSWKRSSPMTWITRVKTPTIVFAGDADVRVPLPQGQELYRALLALGVPTQFVHYPREPHGYREYRHQWDRWTRTLLWFDRWIR